MTKSCRWLSFFVALTATLLTTSDLARSRTTSCTQALALAGSKAELITGVHRDFYRAEEGQPRTLAFFFWHDYPQPRTFYFTLLVDNRQIAFEMEGQGAARLRHEITIPTNEPLVREFTVPRQSRGLHNISLVVFPKAAEPCIPLTAGVTFPPWNDIMRLSRSLLVGLDNPPEFTGARPLFLEDFLMGTFKHELPHQGVWIGRSTPLDPAELQYPPSGVSLRLNERFDFFIYARNEKGEGWPAFQEWALLVFVEARQVPIDSFNAPMTWYKSLFLPPGHEITVPASLKAPSERGTYNLVVMMFAEPYRLTTQETLWMWARTTSHRFELRVGEPAE